MPAALAETSSEEDTPVYRQIFRQRSPGAGGRTGDSPGHRPGPGTSPTPSRFPSGGLNPRVVADVIKGHRGLSHGHGYRRDCFCVLRQPEARLWIVVSPMDRGRLRPRMSCSGPVIHFSIATFVHSRGAIDQRFCVHHPQPYPQDVTLTRPRASVIGASSTLARGSLRAFWRRRPGLDCAWSYPERLGALGSAISPCRIAESEPGRNREQPAA